MRFAVTVTLLLPLIVKLPALEAQVSRQRVDRIFAAYDKPGSPGCALGVIRDGNFIYRKGYGTGNLELGVPLSPQSVLYMASVSKQFTAATVLLAAEKGFLSLDDNVRKHMPELPDYGHPITLRQMLHHTSGFRDFEILLYLAGRDGTSLFTKEEILDLIVRQKGLNNIPGDEWIYSNTNYFLLGEVVKRTTGKSLADFAAENIFKPLGMVHTRFYDDHTLVVPARIPAYEPGVNGTFRLRWSINWDIVGPGGLMSSVDDLLLWDRNFYRSRLGNGTLPKEMTTRGVLNNGTQIGYAAGLEVSTHRGLPIVEHEGGFLGYRTTILRFPEQRFTVACLCNLSSADVGHLSRNVADLFLEKDLQKEARTSQVSDQRSFPDSSTFAGKYFDPRSHSVYSFTASNGSLAAWGSNLTRLGPNRFRDLGSGIIDFDNSDGVMRISLDMDGAKVFVGRRIEDFQISTADAAAFAGSYKSTEIDATYNLSVNAGTVMLTNNRNPPRMLVPIAQNELYHDGLGTILFRSDDAGRISGFSLFTLSARNVGFEKVN